MNILTEQQRGSLYAISSGLCYGLVGYFGMTIIESGYSVFTMLFWRFFVATLCMALVLIPQYKHIDFSSYKQIAKTFAYGMVFYGTSTICYFFGSQYIGTGLSIVVFFTFPAMVMLINILMYKAEVHKMYYLAFGLVMLGMIFLVNFDDIGFNLWGIGMSLLSAFLYAYYIISSKKVSIQPMLSTFLISLGCMLTSLIFALFDSSMYLPTTLDSWFNIGSMGLICSAIPILLLLQSQKYISSEKASMLSVLEPVFVVLFGMLLLDEQIKATEFLGIAIILSGAFLTLFTNDKATLKASG